MKVIVDLAGGFGNQLFCYAFGYAMAREKNASLIIDTSMQDNGVARELELLNLNVVYDERITYLYRRNAISRMLFNKIRKKRALGWKTKRYFEQTPTQYEQAVNDVDQDTYFKGNWQTEKYFSQYREELLRMLTPKEERSDSVKKLCKELQGANSVAVHVRRGDYVKIGVQLDMEYYEKAVDLMKAVCPGKKLVLYVFSDDVDFCKEYFSSPKYQEDERIDLQYPEYDSENHTLDDMILMSNCHHMIMANSSYSWWAAWLNQHEDKKVICPELKMWRGDFYPDDWLKIACE